MLVAPVEADFVGSALVRESVNSSVGDDDKLYFFFTEKSQEQSAFSGQGRVARVARICKVRPTRDPPAALRKHFHSSHLLVCLAHLLYSAVAIAAVTSASATLLTECLSYAIRSGL